MSLSTDKFFYRALKADTAIMKATGGRIFNPARTTADEKEDRIPYITITLDEVDNQSETKDDIEDGRPHGARVTMLFYLPKTVDADLRDALIACYPTDDATLSGKQFEVVGDPFSYPRASTPGEYSWCVEAVRYLG